jgi:hypothetical protein
MKTLPGFCAVILSMTLGLAATAHATPEKSAPVTPAAPMPFGAPTDLVATLVDPLNIDLKWKDNATNEAGYFVEYSPDANNEYMIIEALPANTTTYRHANLLPETRFVFRVRPFFGEASNVAEIVTGKEAPQQELRDDDARARPVAPLARRSLKTVATLPGAAPTHLTAVLIPPAGVSLKWEEHAQDADGCLLEIKGAEGDFRPSAFLEPGCTSLISYNFPFESHFSFRVRSFFYGQPSNLSEQTTGQDPTMSVTPPAAGANVSKPATH